MPRMVKGRWAMLSGLFRCVPGMDMISFGPTLEGVHSPDEKIYIDTVEKFWKFLLSILSSAS